MADKGERKFKGWSDNGQKAFAQWTKDIKADAANGMYAIWEKAFRVVELELRVKTRRQAVNKYEVDKMLVWEEL